MSIGHWMAKNHCLTTLANEFIAYSNALSRIMYAESRSYQNLYSLQVEPVK